MWRENDFWEKLPVNSPDTLGIKKILTKSQEIVLSCTVSEIYAFWRFTQKFKMPPKMAGKRFLGKVTS